MVEVEHASILLDFFSISSADPFALKPQEWFQVESDGTGTIGITQAGLSPKQTGEVSLGWINLASGGTAQLGRDCVLPFAGARHSFQGAY